MASIWIPDIFINNYNELIPANQLIESADDSLKEVLTFDFNFEDNDGIPNTPLGDASMIMTTKYYERFSQAIENYLEAITTKHALIEKASDLLAEMQQKKVSAEANDNAPAMSIAMINFLNTYGIKFDLTGGYSTHNEKEWQVNIEYLNSWIKGRSNEVETDVIKLNDIINKQNQNLQSTTTVLKKLHDILTNMVNKLV